MDLIEVIKELDSMTGRAMAAGDGGWNHGGQKGGTR